jgi:RNA-splicing ligase RtcB
MPEKIGNVLSWAPDIDGKTLAQAQRSAALPFVEPHVALMPDAHFGYGATVGSVIPTKGAIIPSAIGVDIGCGMIAAQLQHTFADGVRPLTASDLPDDLRALHSKIAKAIPAGVGQGHDLGSGPAGSVLAFPDWQTAAWTDKLRQTALQQFGSLGSGNHFVELSLDENDNVWLVLHSGSRGVGNKLANYHIDGAKGLMKDMFINLDDPDLAYLVEGTAAFDDYISDMLWAQDYAMGNRERMLLAAVAAVASVLGRNVSFADRINCHHNFTQREHHMGKNLWITRKGAIQAREGDRGVIPGSMGTETFIVSGKGSAASFCSCSHGAGRKMSRAAAKRALTIESLFERMEGKTWNVHAAPLLDEHPDAYKDINEVMANQADLVTIEHTLTQVLNYKGT